jgi:hypothetical protein
MRSLCGVNGSCPDIYWDNSGGARRQHAAQTDSHEETVVHRVEADFRAMAVSDQSMYLFDVGDARLAEIG